MLIIVKFLKPFSLFKSLFIYLKHSDNFDFKLIMEVFLKREYKQHRVKCLLEEADSVIPEMKLLCGNLAEEILWDVSQHSAVRGDTTGLCRV